MKLIEDKNYYKMSELVELTKLNNHTISFYNKKGLLPQSINTSKNMKYYPEITITVLNLIIYLKDRLNFSIDYIKELFDYYNIDYENRAELIVQSIEMITDDIENLLEKEKLNSIELKEAVAIGLLEDKEFYFKNELEVLKIYSELKKYEVSTELIQEYISSSKKLAKIERKLSQKVLEKTEIPEILVLDILHFFKPYIFNKHTINEFKEE